jgi:chemotaxis protein MotB
MLLLAAFFACVSQADYDALMAENARLTQRVEKLDKQIDAQIQQVKELQEELKPLIDRGLLKIDLDHGRVTLSLSSDVLFASGSAALSNDGKDTVGQLARALARRASDTDFQVEGHTDSDPINTAEFPDNYYLGAARGIVVAEYMIAQGFPRQHLSASTYADTRPAATNATNQGQAWNRRIEVVLVPDMSELAGYKRLEKSLNGESGGGKGEGKKGKGKKNK